MVQAILLAAGVSTRTYPLTETRPKPLLKVANKTLLEHNIAALQGKVSEIILIVHYKKEMIEEEARVLEKKYKIPCTYIDQVIPMGTGHALLQVESLVKDKFLVMNGDDLYGRENIIAALRNPLCSVAAVVDNPKLFGIFETTDGNLKNLVEKPEHPKSNLANTGLHVLDKRIFSILKKTKKSKRGEIELTDAILALSKETLYPIISAVDYWFPITYPWSLLNANEFFLSRLKKSSLVGRVEKGVTIKGTVILGKGSVLKSGTYIEGPVIIGEQAVLGPNCYVRAGTTIGDNCKVGQAVEIKNSILMNDAKVPHLSYVGDSIIGSGVNLGAGTIVANLRHDGQNIKSTVKGELIDTGRRKLGAIIGDHVHTGIHSTIYPGRKIASRGSTLPGEIVKRDIG